MKRPILHRGLLSTAVVLTLLVVAACENIALLPRATPEVDGDDIVGEVTGIDTRKNEIYLRQTEPRREARRIIRYSEQTQVTYRGRDYPVNALEVGDIVALQVWAREGNSFTHLIRVQQNIRDRDLARAGAQQRIEGTVQSLDRRAGSFEIRDQSGENIVVSIAPNASRSVLDEVDRLRRGDRIVGEGRFVSRHRFELDNLY